MAVCKFCKKDREMMYSSDVCEHCYELIRESEEERIKGDCLD